MQGSSYRSGAARTNRGPAMYLGYCHGARQYRMMDLPEYVSNMHEGVSRMVSDSASAYQDMFSSYPSMAGTATMPGGGTATMPWTRSRECGCHEHGCREHGCRECHCECCVSDADVLIHVRCGELRRIPLTFENDSRRDRPVTLELGKFVSSGGRDLGWPAKLSQAEFTLRPCDEQTVILEVGILCGSTNIGGNTPPGGTNPGGTPGTTNPGSTTPKATDPGATLGRLAGNDRLGSVDRCEVGYGTIRAEGCLSRPIVVAVAVLPDDCDAFRHPCGCDCCH